MAQNISVPDIGEFESVEIIEVLVKVGDQINKDEKIASITWHAQKPYNLTNYKNNKAPYNLPYRILNKLKRETNSIFGKPYIQRNWELQFEGAENAKKLERYLFDSDFNTWIPKHIVEDVYKNFLNSDRINYSHAVSMLLTLSVWNKKETNI